jgi:hypothetical protein
MMSSTTGSVALTPPTQGTYQGVVAFQDRTSSAPNSITGNGNINITGTIYTPASTITVTANSNNKTASGAPVDNVGSQIIANSMNVSGTGTFQVYSPSAAPVRVIQLIE